MHTKFAVRSLFAGVFVIASVMRAATIDRIEIVVDHQVITELELEEDIQIVDFLNGTALSAATDSNTQVNRRRAAAERLINQTLVKEEMRLSHFPWVDDSAVDKALEELRETKAPDVFESSLNRSQISSAALRNHLALQLTTARFVAFRFRPELGITDADLEEYYRRLASTWAVSHPNQPLPGFEASKTAIRHTLVEERTNQALDDWLQDARERAQISYVDITLQAAQ